VLARFAGAPVIKEFSGGIPGGAWILLVGENVQVGEVEEREEQGQSGLQVAVPCNAGDYIYIYICVCFRD
jgi:hypothetical protein